MKDYNGSVLNDPLTQRIDILKYTRLELYGYNKLIFIK